MPEHIHVFISYKKLEHHITPVYAFQLAHVLQETFHFRVFLDDVHMKTADRWENQIYEEIHEADVLILLLVPETANSEWVQREIDVARGAGVSIIQLLIGNLNDEDIHNATAKLALSGEQYSHPFQATDADYTALADDIRRLTLVTRERQRAQYREREKHWFQLPMESHWKALSYHLRDGLLPQTTIHITVGDILAMPPGALDVIVNSENDYLQMARFYQIRALSGALRRSGALFRNGRLIEDTVQQDLWAIYTDSLPIALCQVLVTKAGHPQADLRARKRLKLIFHAVAVQYAIGHETVPVQPMNSHQFDTTICNCIDQVYAVNADAALRASIDPSFSAITSLAFPLFGTGGSSLSIPAAATYLVEGLYRALKTLINEGRADAFTVTDIHLMAYSSTEADPLQREMEKLFEVVSQ